MIHDSNENNYIYLRLSHIGRQVRCLQHLTSFKFPYFVEPCSFKSVLKLLIDALVPDSDYVVDRASCSVDHNFVLIFPESYWQRETIEGDRVSFYL